MQNKMNNEGNTEKFVALYGDNLKWAKEWKVWIVRNGNHWDRANNVWVEYVFPFVRDVLPSIKYDDSDTQTKWLNWCELSGMTSQINAIEKLARKRLRIIIADIKQSDTWGDDPEDTIAMMIAREAEITDDMQKKTTKSGKAKAITKAKHTEGKAVSNDELQCYVISIAYAFKTRVGQIFMARGNCTDTTGAISYFTRLYPEVTTIETHSASNENESSYVKDTVYRKIGGEWVTDATYQHGQRRNW